MPLDLILQLITLQAQLFRPLEFSSIHLALQSRPSYFLAFWPYKAGIPCFLAFWPYKAGLSCFLIYFPFCWELLGLCPRADGALTIPWIITKCLAFHLATSNFFCSDRINHPTRSMHKTLWRRWHPTVPYLLRLANCAIGHFRIRGMIQRRP